MICNVMEQKAACGFSDDAGGIYPQILVSCSRAGGSVYRETERGGSVYNDPKDLGKIFIIE